MVSTGEEQIPDMVVIVRCAGAAEHLPLAAKAISESIDPKLFPEIRLVKALYNKNVQTIEQVAEVVALIGLVAVVLAGVGVIGLVSFTVRQRKKEIAIRLALGSSGQNILKVVLLQFSWPVLIGLLVGTGAAAAGSKVLRRALFGVSNLDPDRVSPARSLF